MCDGSIICLKCDRCERRTLSDGDFRGDGRRTERVCGEGSSESCVSHLRLWWLLFLNGKIEKCTRSCHGKGKAQKLFTYRRVPSGAAVWQIINKLFIWRETCFFDGGELKKRAALPYCVSTELWLEKGFVSAQEKEGRAFLSLAPVKRPPCSVRIALSYRLG